MTRWTTATLVAILSLCFAIQASAFDGQKKGFLLGGGFGIGNDSFTQELTDGFQKLESDRENEFSISSSFKIGGGISEQFLLYYHNQMAWFGIENMMGNSITIGSGVTGVGFTYFTSPAATGFFLTGTVGAAFWDAPFEDNFDAWTSFGVIAGLGFEFAPHWSVDASFLLGAPETTEGGLTATTNSASFLVTVTGLAY